MPQIILEASGVSRRFGWRWALRGVDLAIARGRRMAVLGANGSGKTTLLKTLAGLLRPNEGEVRLGGEPMTTAARGRIGLLGHEPFLYPALTLRENLEFFAKLFRLPPGAVRERIGRVCGALDLTDRLDEPIRALSQGLCQRAALARAMLHEPEVYLLDEPFSGLDPGAAESLEGLLRNLPGGGGRSVVLTTHDIGRALDLTDEVVVLARGEVVFRAASSEATLERVAEALGGAGR